MNKSYKFIKRFKFDSKPQKQNESQKNTQEHIKQHLVNCLWVLVSLKLSN